MSIWKITPEFGVHHKAHWIEINTKPLYSQNVNFLWVKIELDHVQMIANLYNKNMEITVTAIPVNCYNYELGAYP